MSQANVEVVKAAFDAWNAGDMNRLRDRYDPNLVMQTVPDWPEPGPYLGREAVMGFFKRLRETWDSDANRTEQGLHRGRRPRSRQTHLAWAGARPGPEHGDDAHLHVAPGQSHLSGVLLGSRRGPQSRGTGGLGDVAGEVMTTCRLSPATNEMGETWPVISGR